MSSSGMLPCAALIYRRIVRRLLAAANFVPSSPILVTLVMEALRSSETSVLTKATRHNVSEDGVIKKFPCSTSKMPISILS
jgi:hypothetical protein